MNLTWGRCHIMLLCNAWLRLAATAVVRLEGGRAPCTAQGFLLCRRSPRHGLAPASNSGATSESASWPASRADSSTLREQLVPGPPERVVAVQCEPPAWVQFTGELHYTFTTLPASESPVRQVKS